MKGDEQTEQRKLQKLIMKTDKNSQTIIRSGTLLQPEQAVPDTNNGKEFEAEIHFTQRSIAYIWINAKSLAEAKRRADLIKCENIESWIIEKGVFHVHSVEPLEGGQDDE